MFRRASGSANKIPHQTAFKEVKLNVNWFGSDLLGMPVTGKSDTRMVGKGVLGLISVCASGACSCPVQAGCLD